MTAAQDGVEVNTILNQNGKLRLLHKILNGYTGWVILNHISFAIMKTKYKRNNNVEEYKGFGVGGAWFPKKLSFFGNILKIGFLDTQFTPVGIIYGLLRLLFYAPPACSLEFFTALSIHATCANFYIISCKIFDFVKVKFLCFEGILWFWLLSSLEIKLKILKFGCKNFDVYQYFLQSSRFNNPKEQKTYLQSELNDLCFIYFILSPLVQIDLINFINFLKKRDKYLC